MAQKSKTLLLWALVLIEVNSAVLAWRDLSWRSDGQVRGKKKTWRVFIVLNPGNSFVYWIFGRRGARGVAPGASIAQTHAS